MESYCLKCKAKTEMIEAKPDKFKNGTPIMKGKCAKCGNTTFKIQKKATV